MHIYEMENVFFMFYINNIAWLYSTSAGNARYAPYSFDNGDVAHLGTLVVKANNRKLCL